MNRSESIGQLAEALAKAQGVIQNAIKDSSNPFFKSNYADLASVRNVCHGPLSANGLALSQLPENHEGRMVLTTLLMHSSGEWLSGELEMTPVKSDPQGIGSAITYARRYALAAITGVATEDDDGNAASGNKPVGAIGEKTFGKAKAIPAAVIANVPVISEEDAEELVEFNAEHPPIVVGESASTEKISQGESANFAKEFRMSLDPKLRPQAEILRHEWLSKNGYIDADGNPSAKMIGKNGFIVTRNAACQWAAEQTEERAGS